MQTIRVRGARTHNLRSIDLDLPRERLIVITGHEPGQQVLAMPITKGEIQKEWTTAGNVAVLSFQCSESRCALRDVWMGGDSGPVYRMAVPSLRKAELASVTEVVMHPVKGD